MSQKTALSLKFAPDDYLVTWRLPSTKGGTFAAHGALTVAAGQPPMGVAHGEFYHVLETMTGGGFGFPQSVEVPALIGSMSNGANVVLVDARVEYWLPNQARITAAAAVITLADVSDTEEARFASFKIQISGLDAVTGVSPIRRTNFPEKGAAGTWSAELRSDFEQEWCDAEASMTLTYYGSFRSFDPFAFRMGFSPVLECELLNAVSLHRLLDEWINPLRRVISVATGRSETITFLSVCSKIESDRGRDGQLFGSGITQDPYESTQEGVIKVNSPLRLKTQEISLLDLVRTWQGLMVAHHPLIETYGSMLHTADQHPRSRFLLLLQAIEGTYGHETRESFTRRQKKHDDLRGEIIGLVRESLDGGQLKFLERNLGKRPPGGLENAINWLAKRLPGDVRKTLESTDLVAAVKAEPVKARNSADALRIIRNNLAHGTKGYDDFELRGVVRVLELIVRANALQLLGCPEAVICRVLEAS
ncbi:hypothetical protein AB0C38_09995 [Amycolatopsis sp. NPDC048633]|uniref:ApeA N-terminal domain 1-containing protein n=1 Tax=Amycolatopsis sp. NPDC048633 TaxID=3157095 RepID=UPI0033DE4677